MIYLFHGFGSDVASSATVLALMDGLNVDQDFIVPITYSYWDADRAAKNIENHIDPDDPNPIFIGVSLGGFWARYYANLPCFEGCKLILINPSLKAHESLYNRVGDTVYGHPITSELPEAMKPYSVSKDHPSISISVIVATDDNIVDPSIALTEYENRATVLKTTGGHRLSVGGEILDFINNQIEAIW